jgi:chromosome segregation ATPase
MKNTIIAIGALAAITLLSSCGQREEDKLAIDQLTSQNNHLIHKTAERNGQISKFKSEINSIHQSLQLIKEQEQLIGATSDVDLQTSATIQADLEKLSDLLSHNKNKINSLNASLNSRDLKLDDFRLTVDMLKSQLEDRAMSLSNLVRTLTDKNIEIAGLIEAQEALLLDLSIEKDMAHQAFYTFGSMSELKENNVMQRQDGISGLLGQKKIAEELNTDYYFEIDTRVVNEVPLIANSARVVSTHPPASYEFVGDETVEAIRILDPSSFWSVTKYLTVVVN